MNFVNLKTGKEKPVRLHHPWIFSGAIARAGGNPEPGEIVAINDAGGAFLAWGYYNPQSQIALRLLEWQQSAPVDENWWRRKIGDAIHRRNHLFQRDDTDSFRLVHAEADFLPGLIVDKYADFVVLQSQTAGIDRVKQVVVDTLIETLKPAGIYERGDQTARRLEGLSHANGLLSGETAPDLLEIKENGLRFLVNLRHGQKTGYYLDQRQNRQRVASFAKNRTMLDAFSYSGSFGLYGRIAGATSIICIDSSPTSLDLLKKNFGINSYQVVEDELVHGDVFQVLRKFHEEGRAFDLIVLDPPKLAPTKAQAGQAQRAYKDLNLSAMKLLSPAGILATFSCSSGITIEGFQQIVAWAALDAGREVQIMERLSQGEDHPVRLAFPESQYLKGLICRII
ncbi:MAG TPA: class I SAM-dependent rRNA methyltransferase [bacterium]